MQLWPPATPSTHTPTPTRVAAYAFALSTPHAASGPAEMVVSGASRNKALCASQQEDEGLAEAEAGRRLGSLLHPWRAAGFPGAAAAAGRAEAGGDGEVRAGAAGVRAAVAAGDAEAGAGEADAGAGVDGAGGAEEGQGRGQGREEGRAAQHFVE